MTDITERLRTEPCLEHGCYVIGIEAADEINRLRARIAELESQPADQYTAELVEIDGHTYGMRPGAARVVREALKDAERYRWLRCGGWEVLQDPKYWTPELRFDGVIDAAMAKDGA